VSLYYLNLIRLLLDPADEVLVAARRQSSFALGFEAE